MTAKALARWGSGRSPVARRFCQVQAVMSNVQRDSCGLMFSYKAVWPTLALDQGQSNCWLSMRRDVWAMQRDRG